MAVKDKQLPAVMQPVITASQAVDAIKQLQGFVKDLLVENQDFGKIPGVSKNTLLKPGAEKLNKVYGFRPSHIEIVQQEENWEAEPPRFDYTIKTVLVDPDGGIVGIGLGSCNSWESKYKYRNAARVCPECGADALMRSKFPDKNTGDKGWYCFAKKNGCGAQFHSADPQIAGQEVGKTDNPDIADQKNTVLKVAKKRSLIDATINATMSSDLFTQDVEDFASYDRSNVVDAEEVEEVKAPPKPAEKAPSTARSSQSNTPAASARGTQEKPAASSPATTGESAKGSESSCGKGKNPAFDGELRKVIATCTQLEQEYNSPPAETASLLMDLFTLVHGVQSRTKLNAFMGGKHGINATNKAEKYTWAVFHDAIAHIREEAERG